MAPLVELIRSGKARRAASHHGHLFPCAHLWGPGIRITLLIGILNDGILVFLRGYRLSHQIAGAGRLAQGGADPGCKLRKAVGLCEPAVSLLPVPGVNQIVPLRHQIVERTAAGHPAKIHSRLAEGNAALHTAGPLEPLPLQRKMLVELHEIFDPLLRLRITGDFSFIIHKSGWFSHYHSSPFLYLLPLTA